MTRKRESLKHGKVVEREEKQKTERRGRKSVKLKWKLEG